MAQEKVKDVLELIKDKEEEVQNEIARAEASMKKNLQERLEELRLQIEREKKTFEDRLQQRRKESTEQIQQKRQQLHEENQKLLESHRQKLLTNLDRAVQFALKMLMEE